MSWESDFIGAFYICPVDATGTRVRLRFRTALYLSIAFKSRFGHGYGYGHGNESSQMTRVTGNAIIPYYVMR